MNKEYHRCSIRLKDYDYSQPGAYFVTVCVKGQKCLLGNDNKGQIHPSPIGKVTTKFWDEIPEHFENAQLEAFVFMPNHLHGIIILRDKVGVQYIEPLQKNEFQNILPGSIGSIIRSYKAVVRRWCKRNNYLNFQWQRNYYEHIIRNTKELKQIQEYIINNPLRWKYDKENPEGIQDDREREFWANFT